MQEPRRNTVTLVLGGARSGKSHYAQQLGEHAGRVVFVATAQPGDDEEMLRKVDRHRSSRPAHWQTVEEPLAAGRGNRPLRLRLRPDDHRLPDLLRR